MPFNQQPAKISRPNVSGIFLRERLLRLLDGAGGEAITWISAPAGSGKTTLLSSWLDSRNITALWYRADKGDIDPANFFHYMGLAAKVAAPRKKEPLPHLTPEYLQALPVFTRRFMETFFARLNPGAVVVIDDFHAAALSPLFIDIIGTMADLLPSDVRLFVVSREDPPAEYSRLKLNNLLDLISWAEVRFTLEETEGLLKYRGRDSRGAKGLQTMTDGWAAGLLLMERLGHLSGEADAAGSRDELFDYFMTEVIGEADEEIAQFLMRTAWFPEFTVAMAEAVVDKKRVRALLTGLVKKNFFIERYVGSPVKFRYHQLFREFLLAKAGSDLSRDEISILQTRTAAILEAAGQTDNALQLYLDAGVWDRATGLIIEAAPEMLMQGRSKPLEEWLAKLPEPLFEKNPWLSYYSGECGMTYDLHKARASYERSYKLFKELPDANGAYLAWCGVVETYLFEWGDFHPVDRWIDELGKLGEVFPQFSPKPGPELRIMNTRMAVLMHRDSYGQELAKLANALEEMMFNDVDPFLRIMVANNLIFFYTSLRGNLARAIALFERLSIYKMETKGGNLVSIGWEQTRASLCWMKGDSEGCRDAVSRGLSIGKDRGVHMWDFHLIAQGIFNEVSTGDPGEAENMLSKMRGMISNPCHMQACEYHYLSYLLASRRGDVNSMEEHSATGLKIAQETGAVWAESFLWLARARTCFVNNKRDEAEAALNNSEEMCLSADNLFIKWTILEEQILIALDDGDERKALDLLRVYFALMRKCSFVNSAHWHNDTMVLLSALALEHNIETDYVKELIIKRNMEPSDNSSLYLYWPMPLKVYTLGIFRLEINGEVFEPSRKGHRKLMDILKTLIALGGEDVRTERLADILWPETEGDLALHALETAFYRLRKVLGRSDVIIVRDGRASLNRKVCLVDALAFLDMTSRTDCPVEKTLALYKGSFLKDDEGLDWTLSMREKLRDRYLTLVIKTLRGYENEGDREGSYRICSRGLEIEPLSEELARGAMRALAVLGRQSEAIILYNRLERDLANDVGISPSTKTKAILKELHDSN